MGETTGAVAVPANHRQAERALVCLVQEGQWEIDDAGRIWRVALRTGLKTGGSHVVPTPRRRAEKAIPGGYLMVRALLAGRRVYGLAHRVVWQWHRGDIPDGLCLNHINGDKRDNRPSNLEVVTYSENVRHDFAVLHTRDQRGELNSAAKLTHAQVIEIRARRAVGERLLAIARDYGVSFQVVSSVARGRRYQGAGGIVSTVDGRSTLVAVRDEHGHFTGEFLDG